VEEESGGANPEPGEAPPAAPPETPPETPMAAVKSAEPDPVVEVTPPEAEPPRRPVARALLWFGVGLAVLGVAQIPFLIMHRRAQQRARAAATQVASTRPSASASSAPSLSASASSLQKPTLVDADAGPAPFRVALLELDPSFEVAQTKVGKRSCEVALHALGVAKEDIAEVQKASERVRKLVCRSNDRLTVAMSKDGKHLRALELETAPGELLRLRERTLAIPASSSSDAGVAGDAQGSVGAEGEWIVEEVSLPVSHRRHTAALVVVSDLPAAILTAGLDPSLLDPLDDAVSSRNDVAAPSAGSVFRVVADATYVAGRFDRYDELVALEYHPRPDAPPLRIYHLREQHHPGGGWYDAKGHQPLRGRWRMPLAFPHITSRFNPRRMHPILHTVMPHNGCDFAAPPGTPVYAIGPGVVSTQGAAGPSGNLVTVAHEGGFDSGYAHLSRFAAGVIPGTHVEAHALVGYVGTTGRSTGPHLHLSVKKNGVFIDPLALKMDGVRVVPPSDRAIFARRREDADAALDQIALPKLEAAPPPAPSASASGSPEPEGEEVP
jgi:hypothetical protein